MSAILRFEQDVVSAGMPVVEDGVPIEDPEDYEQRIYDPKGALLQLLEPRLSTFDFRELPLPSIHLAIDSVVFDCGYRAAADLLVEQPNFDPASLLALYVQEVVAAEPILGSATALHRREVASGELAPLGNAKALGVLTWGLLWQDAFWQHDSRDREAFIAELLNRGFDSRLVGATVRLALEPPLAPARLELRQTKTGHPIAGSLASLRGKVGFTRMHEQQLMDDLRLIQEIEGLPRDEVSIDLRSSSTERLPDGRMRRLPNPRGHLTVWLPMMLERVRRELYPGDYALRLRHGETPEERALYWSRLFASHGYFAGRDQALLEIAAILAGQDEHPSSARIQELQELAAGRGLSAEEARELEQLIGKRRQNRLDVLTQVTSLIAGYGASSQYRDMLETMSLTLPGALAAHGGDDAERILYQAWGAAAIQDTPQVVADLEDYLEGNSVLDPMGAERFLYLVGTRGYPGGDALLAEVLDRGSINDVAASISNSSWMSREQLESVLTRLTGRYEEADCGLLEKARIVGGLVSAILNQSDPSQARADLLKTIEAGRWTPSGSPGDWSRYVPTPGSLDFPRIRELLGSEELESLVEAGKLPKSFL